MGPHLSGSGGKHPAQLIFPRGSRILFLLLRRALRDEDSLVARDAARALGALGKRVSPSVRALVKALSHEEPHVRIYAAEALASISPKAGAATRDLARALGDPIPGVRRARRFHKLEFKR